MEKILFSNSFNQTEYLRTLAKNGKNTFGLRVMSDVEICFYILGHLQKMPDGDFVSSSEEDYIYYGKLNCGDYHDAKNIRIAIDSYRDSEEGDILESLDNNLSDDFLDKKNLIKDKYRAYQDYKAKHHLYDKNDLIAFVINSGIKLNSECFYYQEYDITKVFLKLLTTVFSKVTPIPLSIDFNKKAKDIHFMKAYGKLCECDYVFSEIQKYPLDECQIVLTSSEDTLEVIKTAEMLGIPYTSSLGIPVISTNAGILLNYLFKLEDLSYGVDGYRALFSSKAFNSDIFKQMIPATAKDPDRFFNDFIKYAGWLRLNFASQRSDIPTQLYKPEIAAMLIKLQQLLAKGRAGFIKEVIVSITPNDENVIASIEAVEAAHQKYGIDIDKVLEDLLTSSINQKIAQSGHLFITKVDSAISSLRPHTFIIGLDSSFPGGPKDNYLIFDDEYAKTGSDFYNSKEIVRRKEKILRALIDACEDVYLTYPYFEMASLEENNPSSTFFDLYPGDVSKCPSYGFKDLQLAINKEVYQARLNNKVININNQLPPITYNPQDLLNKKYSPSMFHSFFESEYRLSFLLSTILGIDIQEEDDPYEIISSNERGTLIHALMEKFQKDQVLWADFLKRAEEEFKNFLLKKPAMIKSSAILEKDDYLRIIKNLYDDDPGNEYIASEEYLLGKVNDITFGGLFDRIEKDQFGKYILVDYKTGKVPIHKNDDPVSCIQGLIYGYLINHDQKYAKRGIVISRIEFRYPDPRDTIYINYTPENEKALLDLIDKFKEAIKQGQLFNDIDLGKQKYIDKYGYLISLFERM